MRVIVIGMGVQGPKRQKAAGSACVALVDPVKDQVDYRKVEDVPLKDYDAALVCTPDETKYDLLKYLLSNGKHVLVEKPLLFETNEQIEDLRKIAIAHKAVCYTAYNHRFEPHFVRMKETIESGILGQIYAVRMFYGNGTARLVRDSVWRDQGAGVLPDLGSHLLDTALFWFGLPETGFKVSSSNCFENRAFDHFAFTGGKNPVLQMELTLLMWRNHFYCDVLAEKGSAHITSLCKWGPSTFILRDRKLPSGRPDEQAITLVQDDPTWVAEYQHFVGLCENPAAANFGNLDNDLYINTTLNDLAAQAMGEQIT